MQAIIKGLEKVKQEFDASENDGPVSDTFRKVIWYSTCFQFILISSIPYTVQKVLLRFALTREAYSVWQTLKEFVGNAESEVGAVTHLYSIAVSFS